MKVMKYLIVGLLCIITLGCGGGSHSGDYNVDEVKAAIEVNYAKWKLSALSDYSYTYSRSPGDCPTADELPTMDITVEDNEVVSVFYSGTSEILDFDNAPTIDTLFGVMLGSLNTNPIKFRKSKNENLLPSFDDTLGYPSMFFIDISSKDCDAIFIRVTDFY
jgi:hypothetical protein